MKTRFPRLRRHVAARFSPTEAFGLHLTIGVALLLLGTWIFASIANAVFAHAAMSALDVRVAHYFHQFAASAWTMPMLVVTTWHNTAGIACMGSLLAYYFYRRKLRYWLLATLLAVPGGMLLNVLLKYTFQRARPTFDAPLLTLTTYSFPSGHTTGAAMVYGIAAAYLVCRSRHWAPRVMALTLGCAMVALVAFSRVYLGVHYLSDVLASLAVALAWLSVCISASATLRRRAQNRFESKQQKYSASEQADTGESL